MDPVDPHIHVVAVGQVPLPEPPIVLGPRRREARDVGGTQAGRVLTEQDRQRLAKVARRQPAQIENRQHLGDLRRAAHVRRQDPTREPLALAACLHPFVVDPRRSDLQRPRPAGDFPRLRLAVAHHQPAALLVAVVGVFVDVLRNLYRQGFYEHPARSLPRELI